MAAYNLKAMLLAVRDVVAALPAITTTNGTVYLGEPENFATRINAFLALGDATSGQKATQLVQRRPQVTVWFAYRVAAREEAAETVLCDFVDQITAAIYADRSLAGTSSSADIDTSAAGLPQYQFKSGEYRYYPIVITGSQQQTTS